jgi:hypothetical protein
MSYIPSPLRQTLSPQARRDKAARDKAYAMSPARKAEAQGQDYDHKRQAFVSVRSNRGNEGIGTRSESGNNYNTD